MAEYFSPGVYAEEFHPVVKPMEGVGTSTAGFVGLAARGPVVGRPVRLTSFADYQCRFGGYLSEPEFGKYRFLPNCVEQFFINGGSSCYVMRVAPADAVKAVSADGPIAVEALDPGAWANEVQVVLRRTVRARTQILSITGSANGKRYQLKDAAGFRPGDLVAFQADGKTVYNKITEVNGTIVCMAGALTDDAVDTALKPQKVLSACGVDILVSWEGQEETYTGCTLNPNAPDYLPTVVKESNMIQVTLNLEDQMEDPLALLGAAPSADELRIELSGGTDGTVGKITPETFHGADNGPGKRTGIEAFQEVSDVSIMAVPGITDAQVQAKLIAHCEGLANRFAVLDMPLEAIGVDDLNQHRSAYDTSYAALYAPWVEVYDSLLKRSVFLPPSGSMCGVYARTDMERGVHKAPANEVVRGCTGLSVTYSEAEQGRLNPNGVNLIRPLPGQGIRVWGARTCSSDGNWKYINVRRLFIFLEESIRKNTGWAVSEPNDEDLWSRVKSCIELFLKTQWRSGALAGSTPEEAYFVDIGRNTMSQEDILNGHLICEIGVAPTRPSEFVIFRITQKMQDTI